MIFIFEATLIRKRIEIIHDSGGLLNRKRNVTVEMAEVYLRVVSPTLLLQREMCFNVGERSILQIR
jgi:hypothetical protein